jgi:hypothetical protein
MVLFGQSVLDEFMVEKIRLCKNLYGTGNTYQSITDYCLYRNAFIGVLNCTGEDDHKALHMFNGSSSS